MKYTLNEHILYWFLPLITASSFFIAYAIGPAAYQNWVMNPLGFTETFIASVLLLTIILGAYVLKDPAIWQNKQLRWWLIIYVLGVVYFVGEDQNWGMYYREKYFGYHVPEYFLEYNKEKETNLHNMNSWFNEKPRILVAIWIFVAGLLVPLGWKFPVEKTRKFVPAILWPDRRILPLAILALGARIPERILNLAGMDSKFIRFSEVQELFFAFFMLLFLLQVYQRAKAK